MDLMNIIIETDRLLLKPITLDFAEDIFNEFSWDITKYMYPKPAEKIEETYDFIKNSLMNLKNGIDLQMVIINKNEDEFIGCIGLHNINTLTPELGIWTKKLSHKNGYGLEAMTGLIEWSHKNIKFNYLIYPVDKKNIASRKIPEKNGGKIMEEKKTKGMAGNELDEYVYWIYSKK